MASATTLNKWLDDLAKNIQGAHSSQARSRRAREAFVRKVRHHNHARTNQFDVADRVSGLEEKLQILNYDDLSDELRHRHVELRKFDQRWIPDALDLLLRLSVNLTGNNRGLDAEQGRVQASTPPLLRWSEIEKNDPIDRTDELWQVQAFSDFSSDEDEIESSSRTTSPASAKRAGAFTENKDLSEYSEQLFDVVEVESMDLHPFDSRRRGQNSVVTNQVRLTAPGAVNNTPFTEIRLVREVLFTIQGLPSSIYVQDLTGFHARQNIALSHMSEYIVHAILTSVCEMAGMIDRVRKWVKTPQITGYSQLLQNNIWEILRELDLALSSKEHNLLQIPTTTGATTLLATLQYINEVAKPTLSLSRFVRKAKNADAVGVLDILLEEVRFHEARNDQKALQTLQYLFISTFEYYFKPVEIWILRGSVDNDLESFFVSERIDKSRKSDMWHNWYNIIDSGPSRPPQFLADIVPRIFEAGKVTSLLRLLDVEPSGKGADITRLYQDWMTSPSANTINELPLFSFSFMMDLQRWIDTCCDMRVQQLKTVLAERCGLSWTLDTFTVLYLGQDGVIMDRIESRIFQQIDQCHESWNDRFILANHFEEVFHHSKTAVNPASIMVHSAYTSSRNMQDRRRSVKILSALAIDYAIDWPVANIIRPESMASYRRVALFLCQVRRAKYMLERRGRFFIHNSTLSADLSEQRLLQNLHFMLLAFVNSLYDHLIFYVIQPMTRDLKLQLRGMVDAMVRAHASHVEALEHACLVSQRLKVMNETVILLLDLCIKFSDLVSAPPVDARKTSIDFEAGSFRSAQSKRRRARMKGDSMADDAHGDDDDDDDDEDDREDIAGEGYSTFILEEDSTIAKEAVLIKAQFLKHGSFLLAGLRGLSRSSGKAGEAFEILAARLDTISNRW